MTHDELRELIAREIARDDCGLGPFDDCADCICRNQAAAILAALSTAGLAIVPVEATEALREAENAIDIMSSSFDEIQNLDGMMVSPSAILTVIKHALAASPFTKETGR